MKTSTGRCARFRRTVFPRKRLGLFFFFVDFYLRHSLTSYRIIPILYEGTPIVYILDLDPYRQPTFLYMVGLYYGLRRFKISIDSANYLVG